MKDIIEKAISIKTRSVEEEAQRNLMRIYDLEKKVKELEFKISILVKATNHLVKESK